MIIRAPKNASISSGTTKTPLFYLASVGPMIDLGVRVGGQGSRLCLGAPLGLCVVKGDELNQLFTSPEARGTGVAQALIADAEVRVAAAGYDLIWLDVVAQNERAIRFYEKSGWRRRGEEIVALDTLDEPFELKALIMEKAIA